MSLSIILPCYNPPAGWAKNVVDNYVLLQQRIDKTAELVIVNDGSMNKGLAAEDITYLQAEIPNLRFLSYDVNQGKGYAIRHGVDKAKGDILMYTDIDFPYDIESFMSVYQVLEKGACDVAVGIKNTDYYSKVPFVRRVVSKSLRFMIGIFLSMPVTDTQCGLKGFTVKAKSVFLQTTINRYLFDLEFIRSCFKNRQLKVVAIPVQLNAGVHFRKMNTRILASEMLNFMKLLLK